MDTSQLTQSQELVWLGQQLFPQSPMNNMAFEFVLKGEVDVARMQAAFAKLVRASDALRMVFPSQDGRVSPRVLEHLDFALPFQDFSDLEDGVFLYRQVILPFVEQVFDPEERLFDALLVRPGPSCYWLLLNQHHLITDGWGMSVQVKWLLATYEGREPDPLPSFADYVARVARERKTDETKKLRDAWAERVATYPTPPALFGQVNPTRSPVADRLVTGLDPIPLRTLAERPEFRAWTPDLAMFNLLLTALYAFVYRISGQEDLVIGSPAHNRVTPTDKATGGLFMELFPLRVTVSPEDTFVTLHEKVREASFDFLRYARPGTSSVATGRSFNVLFNYINVPFVEERTEDFLAHWHLPGEMEPGHHFKLQVYDFAATGRLSLCIDCNLEVFGRKKILSSNTFYALLEQMTGDPDQLVRELHPRDRARLTWRSATDDTYPLEKTIVDLFQEQVGQHPQAPAVRFRDLTLSYGELDEKTTAFANQLRGLGIGREDIVPVRLERSEKMLIALLGILKAGAAYLPVDPEFPQERQDFLCADAGARVMVVEEGDLLRVLTLPSPPAPLLGRGETSPVIRKANRVSPLSPGEGPGERDLMYVLYTSGSTGKPKGVMNQHDGLVNRLWWMQQTFRLDPAVDVVLQKTTFTFDVSGWEFWWPLLAGCPVVFAEPGGHKDVDYLQKTIREYGVTTLHFVPPMLELFLLKKADLPSLRRVICSGEALTPNQVNTFREQYPEVELHNLYGPTEAAIDVTHWPVPSLAEQPEPITYVPIGKPITNVPIRILGPEGQFRPIGVPGELYLGGIQVARGYLNRPELTAEKFVTLPGGGRWYRTGDLGRWDFDGNIDFLGRIDSQVKLRGFRIELGEIEYALLERPEVSQAVVLVKKDPAGQEHLTAYVVSPEPVDSTELSYYLGQKLPAYMVPTFFVRVDEIPTTPNGKIDRKRLPGPVNPAGIADLADEAPLSEFEQMIHEAWTEVFAHESIGRNVNFLDLGGHSLTGIRLVNRINEAFELELPANTIFRYPTIATIATHVEATIRELLAAMDED